MDADRPPCYSAAMHTTLNIQQQQGQTGHIPACARVRVGSGF
jgi:hypothetical protein